MVLGTLLSSFLAAPLLNCIGYSTSSALQMAQLSDMKPPRAMSSTPTMDACSISPSYAFASLLDAGYARDMGSVKSTTGFVLFVGGAVSGSSNPGSRVAHSTTEADFVAGEPCTRDMAFLQYILDNLGYRITGYLRCWARIINLYSHSKEPRAPWMHETPQPYLL